MKYQLSGNYLRTHRKRSGLTQRELGLFLGYPDGGLISRHERGKTTPPLIAALAYEVIFRVPVSALFSGLHTEVKRTMEGNLAAFEEGLQQRSGRGRGANETAQKLIWLTERKDLL